MSRQMALTLAAVFFLAAMLILVSLPVVNDTVNELSTVLQQAMRLR